MTSSERLVHATIWNGFSRLGWWRFKLSLLFYFLPFSFVENGKNGFGVGGGVLQRKGWHGPRYRSVS
ncbi:hypothetical protein CC80DRAFT_295721 [Byssothecium circinans]|uniref:Uncharacterized protein n=1 Tax=Byssothecium circinans TaxID=147558 RepID=A0A6A5T9C8_9PLEO|nr:hypothetical protein CC80DRAFT_295721 [Byssothecium circinans]